MANGTVTGLQSTNASASRFMLEVAGERHVVSAAIIGEFRLAVGRPVSDEDRPSLGLAIHQLRVFDRAVAILAVRARSTHELSLRLRRDGASATVIGPIVEELTRLGLLDDQRFADHFALSRTTVSGSGGVSARRLRQELRRKGVRNDAVDRAVRGAVEEGGIDETAAATAVAEKRLRALRSLDDSTRRRRLTAFLARRGYGGEVVRKVVAAVLNGQSFETDES